MKLVRYITYVSLILLLVFMVLGFLYANEKVQAIVFITGVLLASLLTALSSSYKHVPEADRRMFLYFSLSFASYFLARLIWMREELLLGRETHFISLTNLLLFTSYMLMILGVGSYIRRIFGTFNLERKEKLMLVYTVAVFLIGALLSVAFLYEAFLEEYSVAGDFMLHVFFLIMLSASLGLIVFIIYQFWGGYISRYMFVLLSGLFVFVLGDILYILVESLELSYTIPMLSWTLGLIILIGGINFHISQ